MPYGQPAPFAEPDALIAVEGFRPHWREAANRPPDAAVHRDVPETQPADSALVVSA